MEYNFREIEQKWRKFWAENQTYKVVEDSTKPKFYVLDMFPYPSGAGLHVGHPLGYIASDIYSRYKRLEGFNVLHPMGYDSFGLPAEQYAIQTGQHPAITTEQNIARYRDQLDKMGFSFDWSREVRTSSPDYYKWTQWIFKLLFNAYYDIQTNKTTSIENLIAHFEKFGSKNCTAFTEESVDFSPDQWKNFTEKEKENELQKFRIAFLADSWVNWCPSMGTVLANDEVVNGVSVRGGFPVEQKLMRQWSMRIKAYAERLLEGLERIDWSDALKEQQRNWIGKSQGASVCFPLWRGTEGEDVITLDLSSMAENPESIEVFTTRPDTIFGVTFVVLAPEHELVEQLTIASKKTEIAAYQKASSMKTERDRQSDVKNISGVFTGSYAVHPFTGEKVQIWIGDYVLAGYGTGAVMAVPCGDQRDFDFATHFELEIRSIFQDVDISKQAYTEKDAVIANSDFLTGLPAKVAIKKAIQEIENRGIGIGKTNFRLRDAVFSRQRYWGEPFPVYYENEIPKLIENQHLPIELPEVDKYLPTEDGEPPLARSKKEDWNFTQGDRMEYNTMPGWAGSSWYFLRYLDPNNENEFVSKERVDYWGNVDLYLGGSEHATGHLLYSRFWTKALYDLNFIPFDEPFQKLINQGMILGRSSFVYRVNQSNQFVSFNLKENYNVTPIHVDISLVDNDKLDIEGFKNWMPEYENATFILEEDQSYICGFEVEKMSKSKFNVQTPDDLIEKFGADTLRMYEMFLGPLEQSKPWDTKGITGVNGFLRKFWRLFHPMENQFSLAQEQGTEKEMRVLHRTIKRIREDLDRYSFNTCISTFMIAVNELTDLKCNKQEVLKPLVVLIAPFAPHVADELWEQLGERSGSVHTQQYPLVDESFLVESNFDYPVSFNGKMRFKVNLSLQLDAKGVEEHVLQLEETIKWMEGKSPKKVIIVHGKIVNVVL
jgi:leucyl-tRNA synthetase